MPLLLSRIQRHVVSLHPVIHVLPFQQYHNDRVSSRDRSVVNTAKELSLSGYKTGPFSQAKVEQFLREFSQHRTEAKRKADAEKVSWLLSGYSWDWSHQL